MGKPDYTKEDVYQVLEGIAEAAGFKIEYHRIEGTLLGYYYPKSDTIHMPDVQKGDCPPFVLAHEISHALIEYFYKVNLFSYNHSDITKNFIEADADKLASILCHLSARICCHQQEQEENVDEELEIQEI